MSLRKLKVDPFYALGIFFLLAQLLVLSSLLFNPDLRIFLLWSCNNFCILLVYACFRKNMQMIKSLSYLGLVSQILWISDFVSHLLGYNLSGVADYIYIEGFTYANEVSIALHMIVPLTILIFTFRIRPELSSLKYAFAYAFVLYLLTIVWTPADEDINCIFSACSIDVYVSYNILLWPLFAVGSIFLSYVIHQVMYHIWYVVARKGL